MKIRTLGFTAGAIVMLTAVVKNPALGRQQAYADRALGEKITEAVRGFHGDVGVYVRHLPTGRTATFNADSLFPTASMVKVAIQCGLFDRIQRGALTLDSVVVYRDSMKYDDGPTGSLRDSSRIPVGELVHLMLSLSDNTASLWLQALAGTGTAINSWLEGNGFHATRVNSRTPGRESNRAEYGWGQTSPREMAELLVRIRQGKAVSEAVSERMYRNLGRSYWDGEALTQIPPDVHAASKQGAVDHSKSEVALVNAPHGDYVFCVITKNQADDRWKPDNEGYVLIRKVSRLLWTYFEPASAWSPTVGMDKLSP